MEPSNLENFKKINTNTVNKPEIPLNSSFRDELITKFNITRLWHFTHLKNLESIMKNGLCSRNECQKRSLNIVDISDKDIQSYTDEFL